MECGHESLNNTRVVMDDIDQGPEQLVVKLTISSESSDFLWFTPTVNKGPSA